MAPTQSTKVVIMKRLHDGTSQRCTYLNAHFAEACLLEKYKQLHHCEYAWIANFCHGKSQSELRLTLVRSCLQPSLQCSACPPFCHGGNVVCFLGASPCQVEEVSSTLPAVYGQFRREGFFMLGCFFFRFCLGFVFRFWLLGFLAS